MKAVLENITYPVESSFNARFFDLPQFDNPWHYHPEYELTYIVSSHGMRYVGNHVEEFNPGDLVLLGPQLPHSWQNGTSHSGRSQSLVMQWNEGVIPVLPEFKGINKMLKASQRGIKFNQFETEKVVSKLKDIIGTSKVRKFTAVIEILDYLNSLDDFILLAGHSYAYDYKATTNHRLEKVQEYLRRNFQQRISLQQMAMLVNMSEESFSRFFSKTMKMPFFTFLNQFRVNMACRLLIETDLEVSEICYQVGYESLPFFYRQFKKYKQCTPLAFRKLYA